MRKKTFRFSLFFPFFLPKYHKVKSLFLHVFVNRTFLVDQCSEMGLDNAMLRSDNQMKNFYVHTPFKCKDWVKQWYWWRMIGRADIDLEIKITYLFYPLNSHLHHWIYNTLLSPIVLPLMHQEEDFLDKLIFCEI